MGICLKHNLKRNKHSDCPECKKISRRRYNSGLKAKEAIKRREISGNGKIARHIYNQKRRNTPMGQMQNAANSAVHYAIKTGKMTKGPCLICANPKSEAHHAYGYEPENRLNVIFLCRTHHEQAHKDPSFNSQCIALVTQKPT